MSPTPTDGAVRLYREVLLESDLRQLRERFCRTTVESLRSVASWLGADSFMGGGDVGMSPAEPASLDPNRHIAFRALAAVVEMASELASGAITMLDQGHRYASATLVRQLIETEYLLRAFAIDFTTAAEWASATPDEIRRSFAPKTMRSIGGFSSREYWHHCRMGGHPAPSGRPLLRFNHAVAPSEDDFLTASIWADLAQHLGRLWNTTDELLQAEHARYQHVRADERANVRLSEKQWSAADPLADPVDFALLDDIAARMPTEDG